VDPPEAAVDSEASAPSTAAAAENRAALPPDDQRHFSLWGLLALMTLAAVVLGLGSQLPKPVFAGVLGLATLCFMAMLSLIREPPVLWQVSWWVLLVLYLIAIGAAVYGR
jgi:lipopolysaccharide export LptBFGC system permease protein LptF